MKNVFVRALLAVVAITFAAGLSFAADVKTDKKAPVTTEAAAAKTAGEKAVKGELVDINTATDAELKAVPGIGDAYASKIIAGRPYAKKDQLKSRNILPDTVYTKVKDLIIAKQPKKEEKAASKPDPKKK